MTVEAPDDAALAADLLAIDPVGLGGAVLRATAGPARQAWLDRLRAAMPEAAPWRRLPLDAPDDRLIGGLDLAATLAGGRPVAARGLLAEADGGIVVLAMAERASAATCGKLAAVLDRRVVALSREGIEATQPARIALVALDEGIDEEAVPAALAERLAFYLLLDQRTTAAIGDPDHIASARARLATVAVPEAMTVALCEAASALGVGSVRADLFALRAARAHAALRGGSTIEDADAMIAARLVLAPRATHLPSAPSEPAEAETDKAPPEPRADRPAEEDGPSEAGAAESVGDLVLAAAEAAIPSGLLARLRALGPSRVARVAAEGRSRLKDGFGSRGRPVGVRAGKPGGKNRLALIATLRAAAPWQGLRRATTPVGRMLMRPEDLRVERRLAPRRALTIFVVDASGSAALARLGEAKGAVERVLAECYVRRDQVALIAFRGKAAELLLPPTRALARAKRSLAALPGGGGTPVAAGIAAAHDLAEAARRRGETPLIVVLTDGKANIARDGTADRPRAEADARAAARLVAAAHVPALLIDTGPRPEPRARDLAMALDARYLPLPAGGSERIARAVQEVAR